MIAEIKLMRQTINQHKRCIIRPRTHKWVQYWDASSFLCLLFTATVTPVEVTLLTSHSFSELIDQPNHLALFCINRVVDLFFAVDMIFNFFMACICFWDLEPHPFAASLNDERSHLS